MREIKTKFKTCLEEDVPQKDILVFMAEDNTELGRVTLNRLSELDFLELAGKPPGEYLLKCIESWTFTDKKGQVLTVSLDNLNKLKVGRMDKDKYIPGIVMEIYKAALEMNTVSEATEKNSARR